MAIVGSATGTATAMAMGVPTATVGAGLWGYNGCLSAIAVGGMFYLATWRTTVLAVVTAASSTAVQAALAAAFGPYGMPVMTLPFCLATIVAVLLRVYVPQALPRYVLYARRGLTDSGRRRIPLHINIGSNPSASPP